MSRPLATRWDDWFKISLSPCYTRTTHLYRRLSKKLVVLNEGDKWCWWVWWCKFWILWKLIHKTKSLTGPKKAILASPGRETNLSVSSQNSYWRIRGSKSHAHRYCLTACPRGQVDKRYGQHHTRPLSVRISKTIFGLDAMNNPRKSISGDTAVLYLLAKLWIEETNELDVFETEISWNLKGLVGIAIATAVRKKSLATVATAIWFSETPPRRERELDRCSRFATPPPLLCVQCPNL
jgi:hypothetical protein